MVTAIQAKTIGAVTTNYNVLNEIAKATTDGIDWKTEYNRLNYSGDIFMLVQAFGMYDEVNVTESLSGYVFSKEEIETCYFLEWINYLGENVGLGGTGNYPIPDIVNLVYVNPLILVT